MERFYSLSEIHLYANKANTTFTQSQKKAEYSQNRENILNNSPGFTMLLTQLAFFLSSQNKGVILDFYSSEYSAIC